MEYIIHTDGGARGNPGPAAVGVTIANTDGQVCQFGKVIGETTNNVAEYTAVIEALNWFIQNFSQKSENNIYKFFLDSAIVVNQLNGVFKVKDSKLRNLLTKVRIFEQELKGRISYSLIPRELNSNADYMVNQALDKLDFQS